MGKLSSFLKQFDDWFFEKKKGFVYTAMEKIVCYMLLVISIGALGYNISLTIFDPVSSVIFLGAIGFALLIRRQVKKRGLK